MTSNNVLLRKAVTNLQIIVWSCHRVIWTKWRRSHPYREGKVISEKTLLLWIFMVLKFVWDRSHDTSQKLKTLCKLKWTQLEKFTIEVIKKQNVLVYLSAAKTGSLHQILHITQDLVEVEATRKKSIFISNLSMRILWISNLADQRG